MTGLKIAGRPHIKKQLQNLIQGSKYSHIIAGFDLVNEEDYSPCILEFINEMLEHRQKDPEGKYPFIFNSGQTHDKDHENVYDAILLNSKRIGHGFSLALHPHLLNLVKEKDICIEACPISNMLLGYTTDLRSHPVRYMLNRGIQATINSHVPGILGYNGVTLDYFVAYLAWDLDLVDLKKLALNGITYSSNS